jgi:alpha-D-ribose 1-methylphosphonate 5-triphosphate synthase subunit PhnH
MHGAAGRTDAIATAGGFADPVFDSQAVFSAIMNAFARPGTVADLGGRAAAPAPLMPAPAAFLAALADFDTAVWLDETLRNAPALREWMSFQTGAPLTGEAEAASFAVLADAAGLLEMERFAIGTPNYPDRSATLVVQVEALQGGAPLTLSGPGIETVATVAPRGLPDGFAALWARNNALFPLGVDLLLVAGTLAMALTRTTRVREG